MSYADGKSKSSESIRDSGQTGFSCGTAYLGVLNLILRNKDLFLKKIALNSTFL